MNIRHEIKELKNSIEKLGGAPGLANEVKELVSRVNSIEQDASAIKITLDDILSRLEKLEAKKKRATKKKAEEAPADK